MNIVMIDDNSTVLKVNKAMLEKEYAFFATDHLDQYQTLSDFFKSIDANGINFYDVILMDNNLSKDGPSGFDVLVQLQKDGFLGRAVLLTGDDSDTLKAKNQFIATIDYIEKNRHTPNGSAVKLLAEIIAQERKKKPQEKLN